MKLSNLLQRKDLLLSRLQRTYRHSELKKLQIWLKGKTLHWGLYLAAAALVVGGFLGLHALLSSYNYVVRIDEREVGLVRNAEEVEQFLDDLMGQLSAYYSMEVNPLQDITLTRELCWGEEADLQRAQEALRQRILLVTEAVMVTVDGAPVVPVSTEYELASIMEWLALVYVSPNESVKLLEVELVEEIGGESCVVPPEQVFTAQEVASLLTTPGQPQVKLFASRDPLISRSGRNEFLVQSQPETSDFPEFPEVHVITVEEASLVQRIPFSTTYTNNSNMLIGQSRVLSPGIDGWKEGVYRIIRENGVEVTRETLSEEVINEPIPQVVERGTGRRFTWPVAGGGTFTQAFKGSRHMGIDIAAPTGTPILAADSGVVVRSENGGWPMGNYIILNHGGYWTLYLHNSRNLVSIGQSVSRGQTIAYMGSTGYTTGPHLHFEIRRCNGSRVWTGWRAHLAIDPMQFFR